MPCKSLRRGFLLGGTLLLIGFLATCTSAQAPTPTPSPKPTSPAPKLPAGTKCVVNPKSNAMSADVVKPALYKGKWRWFCCESCRYQFSNKPDKFVPKGQ